MLGNRAAYLEIGLSGVSPHFADMARPTTAKAVAELDALRKEIDTLMAATYGEEPPAELNPEVEAVS